MSEHEHRWKRGAHVDGCHFYQSIYSCSCGAVLSTYDERDLEADPHAMIWMDPDSRESCERCDDLIAGAKPRHERIISESVS